MAYAAKAFRDAATIRFRLPNESTSIPAHSRHLSQLSKFSSEWLDQSSDFTLQDELTNHTYNLKDQNELLEQEHQQLIARIQQFITQKGLSKHERIRVKEWLAKLSVKQTNPVWKKNVIFYLRTLAEMMQEGTIGWPFNSLPAEGPLPKLSVYDLPYPLRQRLSQSKEHSSNPKSKKNATRTSLASKKAKAKQDINKSKQAQLYKHLSLLKGFDFDQKTDFNKKVSLGNIGSKPTRLVNKANSKLTCFQFEEEEIELSVAMKSNYSNKTRKQNFQCNSHLNSCKDKLQNLKSIKDDPLGGMRDEDADKENNPNAVNVSRKLFRSKERTNGCSAKSLKGQHSQRSQYSSSAGTSIFGFNNSNVIRDSKSRDDDFQHPKIFGKMFKMLQDNQTALADKPQYCQLLQDLKTIGRQLQLPQFAGSGLEDSTLSEDSKAFMRVTQQIKHKFEETDNETLEFMRFLSRVRGKDKGGPLQIAD